MKVLRYSDTVGQLHGGLLAQSGVQLFQVVSYLLCYDEMNILQSSAVKHKMPQNLTYESLSSPLNVKYVLSFIM